MGVCIGRADHQKLCGPQASRITEKYNVSFQDILDLADQSLAVIF